MYVSSLLDLIADPDFTTFLTPSQTENADGPSGAEIDTRMFLESKTPR